jgi:hypothetical protein
VKVCPAIVIVPLREGPLLAATVYWTVPLPLPLAPVVIVIQASLLVAVQAQPLVTITLTEFVPPDEMKFCMVGVSETVQSEA